MPYKDAERRREYSREHMAKYRAAHPEIVERQQERDKVRWKKMTPEQRKAKEAQRDRVAHAAYMRAYMEKPENRERVRAAARARYAKRMASSDNKFKAQRTEANRRYEEKYRGDLTYQARKILATAKHRSKRKGIPFDLTLDWYLDEFPKGCSATGLAFDPHLEGSPWVPNIDKIVPVKGYVMSNCRLVCSCFNMAKREWTDADVVMMAKALIDKSSVSDQ